MVRAGVLAAVAWAVAGCVGAGGRAALPAAGAGPAPAASRGQTVRAILPQNVRLVVGNAGAPVRSASGVVVGHAYTADGPTSYVLTNAHVVAPRPGEAPKFLVLVDLPTGDAQEFAARVVAQGSVPDLDLAVLEVPGLALEGARLGEDTDLSVGEDVVIIAAPYGRALSASGGMISQVDLDKERRPALIKTDAAIGYGASGGGLFAAGSGKLLGIVEGYRTAKVSIPVAQETYSFDVPMPGETFAAPTAKIRRFLASHGLGALLDPAARAASASPRG